MENLYNEIMLRLSEKVTDLRWIDLDQGQLDMSGEGYSGLCPAAYIGFPSITWESVGEQLQLGTTIVSIRVVNNIYEDILNLTPEAVRNAGLARLMLQKTIHKFLQGFAGSNFNRLQRVSTYIEKRNDGLMVIAMNYQTLLRDESAMPVYVPVMVTAMEETKEITVEVPLQV